MPNIPDTYEKFCAKINNGDIVFVGRGSLISWLIRVATGKPWSHVGFVLRDDRGELWMLEARPGDAKAVKLSNYKKRKLGLVRAPIPYKSIRETWLTLVGTDYAYRHLLWIGIKERLGIAPNYSPSELCCSELVGLTLSIKGVPIDWRCSPGKLSENLAALNFDIIAETA